MGLPSLLTSSAASSHQQHERYVPAPQLDGGLDDRPLPPPLRPSNSGIYVDERTNGSRCRRVSLQPVMQTFGPRAYEYWYFKPLTVLRHDNRCASFLLKYLCDGLSYPCRRWPQPTRIIFSNGLQVRAPTATKTSLVAVTVPSHLHSC